MKGLETVVACTAAALLMAFTIIILVDVVFRYVLKIPLTWPAESSVLLFQWSVFLGAALAVRRHMHFGLDLVTRRLPGPWQRATEGLVLILTVAVSAILIVLGADMTQRSWPSAYATLPLSHGVAYAGVAVAGGLMTIFSAERLVAFFRRPRPGPGGPA